MDYLSHKAVVNKGEREMYIIENHHEPIVDRETFGKVQELLLKNSKKGKALKAKRSILYLKGLYVVIAEQIFKDFIAGI